MVTAGDLEVRVDAALIIIDVQKGFDESFWGVRNNPSCEANIAALATAWSGSGRPMVLVRHDSVHATSPFSPAHPGNAFKATLAGVRADVLVTKNVNSAFLGNPDLAGWLRDRDLSQIVIVGIQTNMCCETTARHGGNLGFDVLFALDATHTFDKTGPDGVVIKADELARVTAVNLHQEFATIVSTAQLLALVSG